MTTQNRYTAVPVTIWANEKWKALAQDTRWLLGLLWTWPARNYAGFVPLQPVAWARCAANATAEDVSRTLKKLVADGMALIDTDTQELWIRPFIRRDAITSPNIYVSALARIQECQSPTLRRAAWNEVLDLHPPAVKSAKPEVRERIQDAFERLKAQMESEGWSPL